MTFSPSDDDDDDAMEEEVSLPYSMPQAQHHATDPCKLSSKHNLDAHINLEEEEEEEDFQTVSLDDEHLTPKEFLTDLYVYMNIHYHTDYAHTCVHMQTTKLLLTMRPWI